MTIVHVRVSDSSYMYHNSFLTRIDETCERATEEKSLADTSQNRNDENRQVCFDSNISFYDFVTANMINQSMLDVIHVHRVRFRVNL